MREIKFRGKRVDTKEWVYGYYAKTVVNNGVPLTLGDCRLHDLIITDGTMYYVEPETVGQFTGLTDKNEREIYEDDILDYPKWVVTYCGGEEGSLGMDVGFYVQRDDFESFSMLDNKKGENDNHLIIGNRHDNPELI